MPNVAPHSFSTYSLAALLATMLTQIAVTGCGESGAIPARKVLRETHSVEARAIVRGDVERHLRGVARAADKMARGFAVEDLAKRESQMRTALKLLGKPPKGIPELISSARTFLAAVDTSGKVVALDTKKDRDKMTGFDAGGQFGVVKRALAGETGYAVEFFPAIEGSTEGSYSLIFAAPSKRNGTVVGAVMTGIPLWRVAQRITRQLKLDHMDEKGMIIWAYVYTGEKLHHLHTPPDLDTVVPDAKVRAAGLAKSPGGFTGQVMQFGRWYAWGVVPVPQLGEEAGLVLFRSDP